MGYESQLTEELLIGRFKHSDSTTPTRCQFRRCLFKMIVTGGTIVLTVIASKSDSGSSRPRVRMVTRALCTSRMWQPNIV